MEFVDIQGVQSHSKVCISDFIGEIKISTELPLLKVPIDYMEVVLKTDVK